MMNDKQLLQVLEGLGNNSRMARSSLATSDSVKAKGREIENAQLHLKKLLLVITVLVLVQQQESCTLCNYS